jgi:hypothetical protein
MSYNPQNPNGQAHSTASAPVVIADDQTAVPVSATSLPLPSGAATAAKQPALGTAGSASADVITVQGIASGTAQPVSMTSTTVTGTVAVTESGTWNVGAATATGSAVPSTALPTGAQARISEQGVTSNTYNIIPIADKVGKLINLPYANPENFISGPASATTTGQTQIIGAQTGLKIYVTNLSLANTGIATSLVTIQNGSTTLWYTIVPAGGGSNITFQNPIATSVNTALNFVAGTASTTIYVSASGYTGV